MEDKELQDRFQALEDRLHALAVRADAPKSATGKQAPLAHFLKFLIANWVLLSFLAVVGTAVYVKFAFGVDYFRDYRSIQARNNLTAFYTHMGDVLMGRSEWEAAKEAYANAVQIDPGNVAATLGIVKAQVFNSPEGEQYYAPEVVDAKLSYLLSLYPQDDQIMFLKGVRMQDQGETAQAITWYKKAIAQNPRSLGSYLNLSFIYMNPPEFDLDQATRYMERAMELDREFPQLYENLGYSYLLRLDLPKAEKYLNTGYHTSPSWDKACSLADAYRYDGAPNYALGLHRWALEQIEKAKPKDRTLGGLSSWNYMPLGPGDRSTIRKTVTVSTLEEKKAFLHYELALDYAMKEDFVAADRETKAAMKADADHKYAQYFAEISSSSETMARPSEKAKRWLDESQRKLNKIATPD